jgi:hypothetical protein
MLTAHLCGDKLMISDSDKLIAKLPAIMLKRSGVERLSLELDTLNRDGRQKSLDLYLRGLVSAIRLLEPGGIVSQPEGEL